MSNSTLGLGEDLADYLQSVSVRESAVLGQLREETAALPEHNMQIAPEQGQFMSLLVKLLGAKKIIEVGTFTGYSALNFAQALPDDGELICCDVSKEWTDVGRRFWEKAGVAQKIDLHIAPATETLESLLAKGAGGFDMVFVDADKENYVRYSELAYELLRDGGLLMVDNVLWGGDVADPENQTTSTLGIRALNQHLFEDPRWDISMVPIGDGLTLARKS